MDSIASSHWTYESSRGTIEAMSTSTTTTPTTTTERTGFWASVRDDLRERREARAIRAQMFRELEGYQSRGDILDLLAAADRHEGPEAELMRGVLQSKLADVNRSSRRAS